MDFVSENFAVDYTGSGQRNINRMANNNSSNEALAIRNYFKEYFNSPEDAVPWQMELVTREQ